MGEVSGFPLWGVLRQTATRHRIEELPVSPTSPRPSLGLRILRKLRLRARPDALAGSPWSRERHQIAARQALGILETDPEAVVVLPAGEDEFCAEFAQAREEIKRRLYVCFHQPAAWFRSQWRRFEELQSLGGIVCLGEDQAEYFRTVSTSPVHVTRHGVRHDFFRPPEDGGSREGNRLLFVGQWLRDFETLADAMPLIWALRPDVTLDFVVPRPPAECEAIRRLTADTRVNGLEYLSNDGLRNVYQRADLLFLPVLDAVANNAVLEAMACGLPVVSSDVSGLREYVSEGAGKLCRPRDAQAHADAAVRWLADGARRIEAGRVARAWAVENFDWGQIGRRLVASIARRD